MSDTRKDIFKKIHERCFQLGSCNYKETGCSDCHINVILVKAETLLDKQEQGLLIELPCKVGDKVWFIRTSNIKPELVETEIEKVVLKKRGLYVQLSCNSFYETSCNSISKTVFFTEAEAEEALAKMGGINNDV